MGGAQPDTLVKDGNTTTFLNLIVSLVCIMMLVLVFKTDNESILLTVCPLEELLFPGDDQPKSVLRRAGLVCRSLLLQLFWAVRLFMAPMCLMSSAYIFADADTALGTAPARRRTPPGWALPTHPNLP